MYLGTDEKKGFRRSTLNLIENDSTGTWKGIALVGVNCDGPFVFLAFNVDFEARFRPVDVGVASWRQSMNLAYVSTGNGFADVRIAGTEHSNSDGVINRRDRLCGGERSESW